MVRGPFRRGMRGHREMQNATALVRQDKKNVENLKANRRHREKIDGNHTLDVVFQKCPPSLRGRFPATDPIFTHAGFADLDAEFEEFAVNARRTPERVLPAQGTN